VYKISDQDDSYTNFEIGNKLPGIGLGAAVNRYPSTGADPTRGLELRIPFNSSPTCHFQT